MPRRTNDFQRLIYLVRHTLAAGAKVRESALLRDRQTRTLREVDVYITGQVGGLPVSISIECRDHRRIADVGWVEAMKAKHERLPTKALMLASRSGFTPEAERVAANYGIRTFTLENVDATDFPTLLGNNSTLWAKTAELTPQIVRAVSLPSGDSPEEIVRLAPDNTLFDREGNVLGPVSQLVELIARSQQATEYILVNGTPEHHWFTLGWDQPTMATGVPFFLQKLDPKGLRQIGSLEIQGPIALRAAPFGVDRAKLGDIHVAWGTAKIGEWNAMMVITRDQEGIERLTVQTSGGQSPPDANRSRTRANARRRSRRTR